MTCWFGHKWGKWTRYICQGKIQARWGGTEMIDFSELRQKRECEVCGRTQDEKVTGTFGR